MMQPSRTGELTELARHANSGGPMSRRRTENLSSTILGRNDGFVRCPRVLRAGLTFSDGDDPVRVMFDILREEGYGHPDDLREDFAVPPGALICRPASGPKWRLRVSVSSRRDILSHGLLLGLCTGQIFDPRRPALWTEASLTRAVELFDPEGFYA